MRCVVLRIESNRMELNSPSIEYSFAANYQVWFAKDALIAILWQRIHVDHTNLCIRRGRLNGHTALHRKIGSNLMKKYQINKRSNF